MADFADGIYKNAIAVVANAVSDDADIISNDAVADVTDAISDYSIVTPSIFVTIPIGEQGFRCHTGAS